jgi:hypothetical protein
LGSSNPPFSVPLIAETTGLGNMMFWHKHKKGIATINQVNMSIISYSNPSFFLFVARIPKISLGKFLVHNIILLLIILMLH